MCLYGVPYQKFLQHFFSSKTFFEVVVVVIVVVVVVVVIVVVVVVVAVISCERLSIIWTLASRGKGELQGGGSQIQSKLFLSLISFSREKSSENSLNQVEANNI